MKNPILINGYEFKEEFENNLYYYLNIGTPEVLKVQEFHYNFSSLLKLAEKISYRKDKYIVCKLSPFLKDSFPLLDPINFNFQISSDDFSGFPVSKDILKVRNSKSEDEQYCFFPLDSMFTLAEFPEDTFGDNLSEVTLFALNEGRKELLNKFLALNNISMLPDFLEKDEIFLHLSCGKIQGYYDSFLMLSKNKINPD